MPICEKCGKEYKYCHQCEYACKCGRKFTNVQSYVAQSSLGKKGSYYQFDFLIDGHIDLEIDGSSHSKEHDYERDNYISRLYEVYRINHHDSLKELEVELNKFVSNIY